MSSGALESPCEIFAPAVPFPVYVRTLMPCVVPTEAPVGVMVPLFNPAAAAVEYPVPSILNVSELPPNLKQYPT